MSAGRRRTLMDALEYEEDKLYSLLEALRERQLGVPETRAIGDISSCDQHPADEGTETYEREKDLGLLQDTQQQLAQVARAREKLVEGSYGICDNCEQPIDPERLQVLPQAVLCIHCKESEEKTKGRYHRPLEEDIYQSANPNEYPHISTYDGTDTWENLAEYGTVDIADTIPDLDSDESVPDIDAKQARMDIDDELWEEINALFPGDPEQEMAEELTPDLEAEWIKEYMEDQRQGSRR